MKGKKSQYDPPYPSRSSVGPGGQRDQEHGVVLHDQEEGYQPPIISRTGSSQVPQGLSMTPPTHQGGPGGQQDQGHGVVLHDQKEGYQPPITSRTGSSQVRQGLSMSPPTCQGGPGVAKYLKKASCSKLRCKP